MRRTALAGCLVLLACVLALPATASGTPASTPLPATVHIDAPIRTGAADVSVLMHARPGHLTSGIATARSAGLAVGSVYESIDVFVAFGPAATFRSIAGTGDYSNLEANRRLSYFTETSHKATRGQNVLDKEVTLPNGDRIDGTGVGVAIVDSGVEGTHPDLADHMGGNVKTICTAPQFVATGFTGFTTCMGPKVFVDVEDSDSISAGGHGTHVSGIVAGDGTSSNGRFHGAAPEATIYGVSVGTTISVENGLDGLEWVLEHHDQVSPEIKVVNNSWGGDHAEYSPDDPFSTALWKLQEDLVADGVTVVFAAGNGGGNGNSATTSAECINPTPGVICVANYDDKNTGTRNGTISSSSSRGKKGDAESYPDVSAPGTNIISTCRATLPVCWAGGGRAPSDNLYANMSGTSMAAPHITGIVAQLYQVDPTLTPAQVENLLEDTAWKDFGSGQYEADPFNGDNNTSFDRGHGLVDVLAAVKALLPPQ